MFGYVVPDKPNMFIKDYNLYKAYYCGLCKSVGKTCGQLMRFTTNYDVTFLNVLLHSIFDKEPLIRQEACVLSPLKKKPIVVDDEISQTVVNVNTLLSYYKLKDDIIDGNSLAKKSLNALVVSGKYKKAKLKLPEIDALICKSYEDLRTLEVQNCGSVDIVSDPFANMLRQVVQIIAKDKFTFELGELLYNIGKWIYTCDAIDDIEKDFKKKNYNPFLVDYNFTSRENFLKEKEDDLQFILLNCYAQIKTNFQSIQTTNSEGVLTNILWYGILNETNQILRRVCKCKKNRL